MTETPPGWYTDPSGLPGAFRWWDGRQWTESLTSDPASTPPPGSPGTTPMPPAADPPAQPAGGGYPPGPPGGFPGGPSGEGFPSGPGGGFPPGPQSEGPVPPPAGAPGPGYIPPPFPAQTGRPEFLSTDPGLYDEPPRKRSKLLVIGGIGLVVLLLLGTAGGFWWLTRDDGTPAASDTPTSTTSPDNEGETDSGTQDDPESSQEPTSPETEEARPSDPAEEPTDDPAPDRPHLTFNPPGGDWAKNRNLGQVLLTEGLAHTHVTEAGWSGPNNDWVAVLAAGYIQSGWGASDLESIADNALTWFAAENFANAEVTRDPLDTSPLEIDGHQGVLVKESFGYQIQGLKATGDTVYVAVVDLGDGQPAGVFIGSVPNTHEQLVADMDKAVASLRVQ